MFTMMGVDAFARRAERELLATGERLRKRNVETRAELTAQEARIARLARDGVTNGEIATRLFISTRRRSSPSRWPRRPTPERR